MSLPLLFTQKDSIFVLLVPFALVSRNRSSLRNGGSFSQVPLLDYHYSLKLIDSLAALHQLRLLRFELLVPFLPHIFQLTTQNALDLILQLFLLQDTLQKSFEHIFEVYFFVGISGIGS